MKKSSVAVFSVFLLICCMSAVAGELPIHMTFTATLTDPDGTVMDDGYYTLRFAIYDMEVGGAAYWEEEQENVHVDNGHFTVELGAVNRIRLTADRDYWLGVTAGSGEESTSRHKVASAGETTYSASTVPVVITTYRRIAPRRFLRERPLSPRLTHKPGVKPPKLKPRPRP